MAIQLNQTEVFSGRKGGVRGSEDSVRRRSGVLNRANLSVCDLRRRIAESDCNDVSELGTPLGLQRWQRIRGFTL